MSKKMSKHSVTLTLPGRVYLDDGTQWPFPDEHFGNIAWKLRYGDPTQPERLYAAQVMDTYASLVTHPATSLAMKIMDLRRFFRKSATIPIESASAQKEAE